MHTLKHLATYASAVAGSLAAALPAYATTAPIPVPEPTTMTLAAVAAAGVALTYRLFR